ncbi:MAG TPA: hypothetical protein DCY00_02850 [Actinobacteria bacterium]|nr:hypothetical protein [Actinomycetota bacterium]
MCKTKFIKTLYIITLIIVFALVGIAILTNISKFTGKRNILRYETVIFESRYQLEETINKNYTIDNRFDFIAEVKKINNINEDDSFLGKPLIIPVIASN